MRQLSKEQKQRARTAYRKYKRRAKFVGSVLPSVQQLQDNAVMVNEHVSARKKQGRSATIPTNHLFCSTNGCRGYRQLGHHPKHWIRGNTKYETRWSQIGQFFQCGWCKTVFLERPRHPFFDLNSPRETVYHALACVAEGVSIRNTARVFHVKAETFFCG
jgi:hypothetical protein